MKAKYFKFICAFAMAGTLFFSSCLKDPRYIDFAASGTVIEMPLSGLHYLGADGLTQSQDTIVLQFAVNIASPNPLSTALTVNIGFSQALLTSYNAANPSIVYGTFPAGSVIAPPSSVTIPAGQRTAILSISFIKHLLDPTQSYMFPLAILGTNNPSVTVSGLYGVHYYHFIGNDFAGSYLYDYTRIPASGNFVGHTGLMLPDSPTQLECISSYYLATERYIITFSKSGSGAGATYSNFQVSMNPSDYQSVFVNNGLSIVTGPTLVNYTAGQSYTYAQVTHGIFKMNYITASGRNVTDYYYKP